MADTDPFREARLPKWTQDILSQLRATVAQQEKEMEAIRDAHAALQTKGWIKLPGFAPDAEFHPQVTLFYFAPNRAISLCDIGPDDVLLVGRNRKEWDIEETKRRYELAAGKSGVSGKKEDKPL